MSPTLLHRQEHGYDVRLYTKDHPPAHVHVFDEGKEAKIGLDPVAVFDNWGFNRREIGQILLLIQDHLAMLLAEWDKSHPRR